MKTIICRHARDDFDSLMTAQGMTDAGADVFSVVHNGMSSFAYIVFAKYDSELTSPEDIDKEISKRLCM